MYSSSVPHIKAIESDSVRVLDRYDWCMYSRNRAHPNNYFRNVPAVFQCARACRPSYPGILVNGVSSNRRKPFFAFQFVVATAASLLCLRHISPAMPSFSPCRLVASFSATSVSSLPAAELNLAISRGFCSLDLVEFLPPTFLTTSFGRLFAVFFERTSVE